jgi:lysophospholipase L1-like esterase
MSGYTTLKILPSSYKSADTSRNVDRALAHKPGLIIISLPSNDMANGYTDQQTLDNFKIIVDKIKAAKIAFIIMSTQPRNFPSFEARQSLALFNDKLKAQFPGKILNVFNKLASPELLINAAYATGDGIHLNNKGHDVIFKTIANDSLFQTIVY